MARPSISSQPWGEHAGQRVQLHTLRCGEAVLRVSDLGCALVAYELPDGAGGRVDKI